MKALYFLPDQGNPFWREVAGGIRRKGAEAALTLQLQDCDRDHELQLRQLQDWVPGVDDAVFVSPVKADQLSPACRTIRDQGVPIIAVDENLGNSVSISVISGNTKGGYLAARHLASCLRKGKEIVHLLAGTSPHVALRRKAFLEEAARHRLEVAKSIEADSSREKAYLALAGFLGEHGRIDGLFAENDAMALGAIDALKEADYSPWPVIVGFDGVPEALEAIRRGTMEATVTQNPGLLGERSFEALQDVVSGRAFDPVIMLLPTLISRLS
jgi:ribose transport system substrate-binding protein